MVTDDGLGAWVVSIGPTGCTVRAVAALGSEIDATTTRISGSARGIYAGLWNRGRHYAIAGDAAPVTALLDQLRVTW